jgi:hypothetical protein
LSSCNLSQEYLETKLKETWTHCTIQQIKELSLNVAAQPIGESYYEFGWWLDSRASWEAKPWGIMIYLN